MHASASPRPAGRVLFAINERLPPSKYPTDGVGRELAQPVHVPIRRIGLTVDEEVFVGPRALLQMVR